MDIIFFGSSKFAVPSLEALIKGRHKVVCTVTQPDKQKGRHLVFSATDVKNTASQAGLKVFQPENVNSKESIKFLREFNADVFVIVAYGQIFSRELLDLPKIMPLNIHASLLPRYRGAAPINWAIINGERKTGLTIFFVTPKMDAGPVMLKQETEIKESDTSETLEDRLSKQAPQLLNEALEKIDNRQYRLIEQDEDNVVLAPKLKKETGLIDWSNSAQDIRNQVRGLLPWPGAFTYLGAKILKIFKTETSIVFAGKKHHPGEIVKADKDGITIACGKGFLRIIELQLEAGRRMSAKDFITGHKIAPFTVLGKK